MNILSKKTAAILNENYQSVVYAREMSEKLWSINQELSTSFLKKKDADISLIKRELLSFNNFLESEKRNITEQGEGNLVVAIDAGYKTYRDSLLIIAQPITTASGLFYLQHKSEDLNQQLMLLSKMNSKAVEVKTDDAKAYSKKALTQMTMIATLCFLIGFSFTFSFGSYFNQRFYQLFNGIKELVSSNYDHRLFFEGSDEFHEISVLLNEMAEKLKKNKQKISVTLPESFSDSNPADIEELKKMLFHLKSLEEQASALVSRFEKK